MTSSAPATPASLVGRETELRALRDHLRGDARLITVLGPPGIGKTRLAAEVFREQQSTNREQRGDPNYVWVDLATVASMDELCARVGQATGLRLSWLERTDLITELGWALEGRGDTALFFDEADRCVSAVREVAAQWISLGSSVRFVITSRERLGIPAETVLELPPLDAGANEDRSAIESASGRLLLERSGAADPHADAPAFAALIRALDGIPLAIELAAARLSLVTPKEMLARWTDQLDLLGDHRNQQNSLRSALEASWSLLSRAERRALAACSIFPGSFSLEAAEAVAGEGAFEALSALRDKSLLARDPTSTQLRLYAPVRAFAMGRCREEAPDAALRHATYFASLARAIFTHDDEERRLETLTRELDDLRVARASADRETAAILGVAIASVLATRGPPREALTVLDAIDALDPPLVARAAFYRGRAFEVSGRLDEAIPCFETARSTADVGLAAQASVAIGRTELSRGNLDEAERASQRALEVAPPSSHVRVVALRECGVVFHARGDLDRAVRAYEEAHAEARDLASPQLAAQLRADLGAARLQQRRLDEASEQLTLALDELGEEGDPVVRALAEGNLAILHLEAGDLDRADALFHSAIGKTRRVGHQLYTAHLLAYAGAVAHERGNVEEAVFDYEEATATLRRIGDARLLAVVASLRGAAEASRDRLDASAEALAEATEALERSPDPGIALTVRIHRLHLRWARARRDDAALAALLETCDELALEPALARSDDARLALRLLRRTLGLGMLSFDAERGLLVLPDGTRVDFSQRIVLLRLLEALVAKRRTAPGESLDAEALLAAGWPGESPRGESGQNRIKVSLSNLRKLGLRDLLKRNETGYFLDPQVPLRG